MTEGYVEVYDKVLRQYTANHRRCSPVSPPPLMEEGVPVVREDNKTGSR
jgi:hypothetical protein